jgi:hypothetical protein
MKIESCTTWQCINSFAPWVSAFGTLCVSIISLWLSIRNQCVRMNVWFAVRKVDYDEKLKGVYIINLVNIGLISFIPTHCGFRFQPYPFYRKKEYIIDIWNDKNVSLNGCEKFGSEFTTGKHAQIVCPIYISNDIFKTTLEENPFFIENTLLALWRVMTLEIFISTSIEKKFNAKIVKGTRCAIWKLYKERKK